MFGLFSQKVLEECWTPFRDCTLDGDRLMLRILFSEELAERPLV